MFPFHCEFTTSHLCHIATTVFVYTPDPPFQDPHISSSPSSPTPTSPFAFVPYEYRLHNPSPPVTIEQFTPPVLLSTPPDHNQYSHNRYTRFPHHIYHLHQLIFHKLHHKIHRPFLHVHSQHSIHPLVLQEEVYGEGPKGFSEV